MFEQFNLKSMANDVMEGIGIPIKRSAEARGGRKLPPGTIVVSADNHWSVTGDIFYENFPARLKDKAPRLWTDDKGFHHWDMNGVSMFPETIRKTFSTFEGVAGCISLEPRLADLDVEGIDKEINFGNAIALFYSFPDVEVRELVFRIYNQHLAEMQRRAPGRFYGVGLINYWNMAKTRSSIDELLSLGLKTFLLPIYPKGAAGEPLNYCLPDMEPMWAAIEESGLPICFHVGEFFQDGPGGIGTTSMTSFAPFRKSMGELIFGGIFDRHPKLQVMFAEADVNWIPGALQVAEMTYDSMSSLLEPQLKERPSHYWHNNCYATFMYDPIGLEMLDIIGADRILWSSDYPHPESTYGYGWSAIDAVVQACSEDDARMILGGTAMKLFKLD